MSMTPADLMSQVDVLDNAIMAGRMPPDDTAGMFPMPDGESLGYHGIYANSTITADLARQLGPAVPSVRQDFEMAAAPSSEPVIPIPGGPTFG